MFNYLTRVADGTGIEVDYESVLPRFVYRGVTESIPRPAPGQWPPVDRSLGLLSLLPDVQRAWDRWREYVLESTGPVPEATRRRLRSIAARAACDGTVAAPDPADTHGAATAEAGLILSAFAEKLSLTPWLMARSDVDALRSTGLDDRSILHVIAIVAYQSAESRLRVGLSALARSSD